MTGPEDCPFCDPDKIATPVVTVTERGVWVMIFEPLNPVVPGHVLVVPTYHVTDAADDPFTTGVVMQVASEVAARHRSFNLITSKGESATQSIGHLHVHVVPRSPNDGLALPWSPHAR